MCELLASGFSIKNMLIGSAQTDTENYRKLSKLCNTNNTKTVFVKKGDKINTGSTTLTFIYPSTEEKVDNINDNSLVFILSYKDFDGIFTGDVGSAGEDIILADKDFMEIIKDKDIELLKVAHHGSKNSSKEEWIDAISPKFAIISAGAGNKYSHPSKELLDRLERNGIKWACTKDVGRISITYHMHGDGDFVTFLHGDGDFVTF